MQIISPTAIATNHPINDFRKGVKRAILDEINAHNPEQAQRFVDTVTEFTMSEANRAAVMINDSSLTETRTQQLNQINQALGIYHTVLHRENHGIAQGRQLYLSSLEQIIVEDMSGIAYSSCKSGKDRKGMEIAPY